MPKPGDRVIVEGTKVGGGRREGTLVGTVGSLIKVRWEDGGETIMAPGAGSIRFLSGGQTAAASKASARSKPAPKKAATKKATTKAKKR